MHSGEERTLTVDADYATGRAAWARRNAMRGSLLIRQVALIIPGVVIGVAVGQRAPLAAAVLVAATLIPSVFALIVQPVRIAAAVRRRYPVGTVLRSVTTESGFTIIEPGGQRFVPWHEMVGARRDGAFVVVRAREGQPMLISAALLPSTEATQDLIDNARAHGATDRSVANPASVPIRAPQVGGSGVLSRRIELTADEARRAALDAAGMILRTRTQLRLQLLPGGALLAISAVVLLALGVSGDAFDLPYPAGLFVAGVVFLIAVPLTLRRSVRRACSGILVAGTVGIDAGEHELRLIYPGREALVPWSALRFVRRGRAAVIAMRRVGGGHPLPGRLLSDDDLRMIQARITASARP